MAGNTKNLGQVSGVHIGNTPPSNTVLIWYDNTPSQKIHKVYDPNLQQWVVLDKNVISAITYSELVNLAKNTGLSVGGWFQITDMNNSLALAITSTKVQYSDSLGNILIDDLGTNIQYHVTSSNLSIDDIIGVFDEVNKKLVFQFNEYTPDLKSDDCIFGKVYRNSIWHLAKYKISSFLSNISGNSLTWNRGFFFNFSNEISKIVDRKGGIVSKNSYDSEISDLKTSIQNVGKENQSIIQNANEKITESTNNNAIYSKQLPSISTNGEAVDIAVGDSLLNIVSKIQIWINKFKYATGIKISKNFSFYSKRAYVNSNDTVESAISKLSKNEQLNEYGNNITLSSDDLVEVTELTDVEKTDSIPTAISKILYRFKTKFKMSFKIVDASSLGYKYVVSLDSDELSKLTNENIVDVLFYCSIVNKSGSLNTLLLKSTILINREEESNHGELKAVPLPNYNELGVYNGTYDKAMLYSYFSNDSIFFVLFGDLNTITGKSAYFIKHV